MAKLNLSDVDNDSEVLQKLESSQKHRVPKNPSTSDFVI